MHSRKLILTMSSTSGVLTIIIASRGWRCILSLRATRQNMSVLCSAGLLLLLSLAVAQDFNFNRGQVPQNFQVGQNYPNRAEETECRPIRVRIRRDSLRFTRDLVINNNPDLDFDAEDARRMTSRMQLLLDTLAARYKRIYRRNLRVLVAWADYLQSPTGLSNASLHYEGERPLRSTSLFTISDVFMLHTSVIM